MADRHPQSQGLEERGNVKMKEMIVGVIGYINMKLSNLYMQDQLKS